MALGIPVAQQVRDTQKRLKRDLTSGVAADVIAAQKDLKSRLVAGVATDVINTQKSLKQRLGLVDKPIKSGAVRKKDKGILDRF